MKHSTQTTILTVILCTSMVGVIYALNCKQYIADFDGPEQEDTKGCDCDLPNGGSCFLYHYDPPAQYCEPAENPYFCDMYGPEGQVGSSPATEYRRQGYCVNLGFCVAFTCLPTGAEPTTIPNQAAPAPWDWGIDVTCQ